MIQEDYDKVKSSFPRLEGSAEEDELITYIIDLAGEDQISLSDFSDSLDTHSFSKTLQFDFKGALADRIYIVIPINGGDFSLTFGISLLRYLQTLDEFPLSVSILFLGANTESDLGLQSFLDDFFPEESTAFWYLDLETAPARVILQAGGEGIVSPNWMIESTLDAMLASDIFFLHQGNENQLFRLGLHDRRTKIDPLLQLEYPSIEFLSNTYDDDADIPSELIKYIEALEKFATYHSEGFPFSWDRHYLFFQLRNLIFVINETQYILIVFIGMALILALALAKPATFKRYAKTIYRNLWDIPVLLLSIFLIFYGSTVLVKMLLFLRKNQSLWESIPVVFILLKFGIGFFSFIFIFQFLKRLPFSRNSSFYTGASIFLFLIALLAILFINISLTSYVLWALFFSILFSIASDKWVKLLCYFGSMSLALKGLWDILTIPSLQAIELFLLSDIYGNLILSLFLLPFVLMLIRLDFIFHIQIETRKNFVIKASYSLFLLLTVVSFGFAVVFQPFSEKNPQKITLEAVQLDSDEMSHSIELRGNGPLGEFTIEDRSGFRLFEHADTTVEFQADFAKRSIENQVLTEDFLNRRRYIITLDSEERSKNIKIRLSSMDEIIIYDANFPSRSFDAGKRIEIYVGTNPPNPLVLDFTIPILPDVELTSLSEFDSLPEDFEITSRTAIFETKLIVETKITL
jgi:hypothetical protein